MAGFTVSSKRSRYYLLGSYVLVGEAIILAMRTVVPARNQTNKVIHAQGTVSTKSKHPCRKTFS